QPDAGHPSSLGRTLADVAVQAGKSDDLIRAATARQNQPLGELPARVLLGLAAVAAKDDARAAESLKVLGERLAKDTLAQTAELACHVALPALDRPALEAPATAVLELAVKNLTTANAENPPTNLMVALARHAFAAKKPDQGKAKLKELLDQG